MRLITLSTVFALTCLTAGGVLAQQPNDRRSEFAVTVGELSGSDPGPATGTLNLNAGVAVQAEYARKVRDLGFGSLYWDVHGLVGPIRYVTGSPIIGTTTLRSVFVTPGVKLQFTPQEKISPWVAAGAGYAFYDAVGTNAGYALVPSPGGTTNTYAVDFGGGFDFALGRRYLLRADLRGVYTGSPNYGVSTPGGQLNFVIGGGIVWRFSK